MYMYIVYILYVCIIYVYLNLTRNSLRKEANDTNTVTDMIDMRKHTHTYTEQTHTHQHTHRSTHSYTHTQMQLCCRDVCHSGSDLDKSVSRKFFLQ